MVFKCFRCGRDVDDPIPLSEDMRYCDKCFREMLWKNLQLDLKRGYKDAESIMKTLRYYFPDDKEKQKDLLAAVMEGLCRFGAELPVGEAKKIFEKWNVGWVIAVEFLRLMSDKYGVRRIYGGG